MSNSRSGLDLILKPTGPTATAGPTRPSFLGRPDQQPRRWLSGGDLSRRVLVDADSAAEVRPRPQPQRLRANRARRSPAQPPGSTQQSSAARTGPAGVSAARAAVGNGSESPPPAPCGPQAMPPPCSALRRPPARGERALDHTKENQRQRGPVVAQRASPRAPRGQCASRPRPIGTLPALGVAVAVPRLHQNNLQVPPSRAAPPAPRWPSPRLAD